MKTNVAGNRSPAKRTNFVLTMLARSNAQNAMHLVEVVLDLRKKTAFHAAPLTMTMMEFANVSKIYYSFNKTPRKNLLMFNEMEKVNIHLFLGKNMSNIHSFFSLPSSL